VERRRLSAWLQAPVHNRRAEVLRLFQVLEEYLHHLRLPPRKEEVFRRIFPQEEFSAQPLRQTAHYLLRATEEWLLFEAMDFSSELSLLKIYRQRQLSRLFEQQYQRVVRQLDKSPYRHPEHYWQLWQLARERYACDSARGRLENLNLTEQEHYLQLATLGFKLRQACLSKAQQQVSEVSDEQQQIPMLDAICATAQESDYQAVPMICLYNLALKLYLEPENEAHFTAFTTTFGKHAEIFPTSEARDLLLIGINYGIKRINTGQLPFMRACFELFQQGLENDLLLEGGKLHPLTYNNIAGIAIRLGELDWATTFLDQYQKKLDPRLRESVYTLNLARMAYARQDYTTALRILPTINDRDFIHHMSARILQLKIYVQTRDIEFALNHIRNTRTYLQRKKNKGYHEQNYRNILHLTERWCRLPPRDKQQLAEWQQSVHETSPLTEKEWLLNLGA
jgi:hypothetical protein